MLNKFQMFPRISDLSVPKNINLCNFYNYFIILRIYMLKQIYKYILFEVSFLRFLCVKQCNLLAVCTIFQLLCYAPYIFQISLIKYMILSNSLQNLAILDFLCYGCGYSPGPWHAQLLK